MARDSMKISGCCQLPRPLKLRCPADGRLARLLSRRSIAALHCRRHDGALRLAAGDGARLDAPFAPDLPGR